MPMLLSCCFGGSLAPKQPAAVAFPQHFNSATSVNVDEGLDAIQPVKKVCEKSSRLPAISSLRFRLATLQGTWLQRVQACVEHVRDVCPAAHVSLFCSSPCGLALVSLGSSSAHAPSGVLPPGQVLTLPWSEGPAACGQPSTSGALLILGAPGVAEAMPGPGAESGVLVWQEPPLPMDAPDAKGHPRLRTPTEQQPGQHRPMADLCPTSAPDDWRPLLASLARELSVAAAGGEMVSTPLLSAALVPARLGTNLVGALLFALLAPGGKPDATAAAAAAATVAPRAGAATAADTTASAAPSASVAEALPGLLCDCEFLLAVSAAVSECCIGPHLDHIQRVTAASNDLSGAVDLQTLASFLSATVTDALSSELHVNFAVRLALVPQVSGVRTLPQYGFMLTETPAPNPAGGQLQPVLSLALGPEAMHRTSTQGRTGAVHGSKMMSYNPAERAVALRSGGKLSGGLASMGSLDVWTGCLANPPGAPLSGVHSFPLTFAQGGSGEPATRSWKARPFSMEATLLAALASKAAKNQPSTMSLNQYGRTGPAGRGPDDAGDVATIVRVQTLTSGLPSYTGGGTAGDGISGSGCFRVHRKGGTVVPHVHAYVNDTDQPSADVVLLFRPAAPAPTAAVGRTGCAASSNSAAAGGASSGVSNSPASLVVVMGSVSLPAMVLADQRGTTAEEEGLLQLAQHAPHGAARTALETASVTSGTRKDGLASAASVHTASSSIMRLTSMTAGTPTAAADGAGAAVRASGGGGGGGGVSDTVLVYLALYLTTQERLPVSLLAAVQNRALELLELLLPAVALSLSTAAAGELQYLYDAVSGSTTAAGANGMYGRSTSLSVPRMVLHSPRSMPANVVRPADERSVAGVTLVDPSAGTAAGTVATRGATTAPTGSTPSISVTGLQALATAGGSTTSLTRGLLTDRAALTSSSFKRNVVIVGPGHRSVGGAGGGGGGSGRDTGELETVGQLGVLRMSRAGGDSPARVLSGGGGGVSGGAAALQAHAGATHIHVNGHASGSWTTVTMLAVSGGRDGSETHPRSRLSNITPQAAAAAVAAANAHNSGVANAVGGSHTTANVNTGTGSTAPTNVIMGSYNSLVAALMGSGSVTGKANATRGGGPGEAYVSTDVTPTTTAILTSLPCSQNLTLQRRAMDRQYGSQQQGGVWLQMAQQQVVPSLLTSAAPSSALMVRASMRPHRPPRRHVSELLTTMPRDVSDTLTLMRSNMDVLISSFWNTLRSHNTEPSPSPHADEDLRFLRLNRVLGDGGCSVVYLGVLHGLEVAVKVVKPPSQDEEGDDEEEPAPLQSPRSDRSFEGELAPGPEARQAKLRAIMRGARELAVMTSISHPNIVQIYSYHTRVLVSSCPDDCTSPAGAADRGSRQHPLPAAVGSPLPPASRMAPPSGADPKEKGLPRLIPVSPEHLASGAVQGPLQTVLIMECCDLGSLADALDNGMFANAVRIAEAARWRHGPPRRSHTFSQLAAVPSSDGAAGSTPWSPSGSGGGGSSGSSSGPRKLSSRAAAGGAAMRAVYLTLLEVALALRHMHAMQLVHCDVKPANVLLKSSCSDPRGFTCKLTDFGFVNLLQLQADDADDPAAKPSMRYHEPVGTVTHLAPETMVQGSKLDHSVDIFAFGILMWEVYTGRAPYAEHAATNFKDVPYRVVREGMRPVFPSSTPIAFRTLAQACWSADVSRRPSASVLVGSLQRLMDAASRN